MAYLQILFLVSMVTSFMDDIISVKFSQRIFCLQIKIHFGRVKSYYFSSQRQSV
jgi:hypothetical protein